MEEENLLIPLLKPISRVEEKTHHAGQINFNMGNPHSQIDFKMEILLVKVISRWEILLVKLISIWKIRLGQNYFLQQGGSEQDD